MLDVAYYLVTREILERAGLAGQRYRSKDGRYVLDNKDLSRVRFTSEEYISGLQGVEKITAEQAKQAIAEGGYQMKEQSLTPNPSPKGEGSEQPANEGSEQPAEPEQEEEQPAESAPGDSVAGSEEVEPTQEEEE